MIDRAMAQCRLVAAALVLAGFSSGCGSGGAAGKDYGAVWPFTVSGGTLRCGGPGWVTLDAAGNTYAINSLAAGQASAEGWHDVHEIWATDPDAGIDIKKNIGPIIDDGLKLCDDGGGAMNVSGKPGDLHTFSDFTAAQKDAYVSAYDECLVEVNAGNDSPNMDAAKAAAESANPGTGDAAFEGCADAADDTPITGSGIKPPG